MTRMTAFSSPFLLGFDQLEQMLDRITKSSGDPYPPYNIERVAGENGTARLRITLAVAGFQADELSIELEGSTLKIRGEQGEDAGRTYLHRGIAARKFERSFVLAEGMEVGGAEMENGLLSIDLKKHVPDPVVRRIPIAERT